MKARYIARESPRLRLATASAEPINHRLFIARPSKGEEKYFLPVLFVLTNFASILSTASSGSCLGEANQASGGPVDDSTVRKLTASSLRLEGRSGPACRRAGSCPAASASALSRDESVPR